MITFKLNCRPLYGSYNPPARGETILDTHFEEKRKREREERIKLRDEIIAYKQQTQSEP